jgi:hypothetical protein
VTSPSPTAIVFGAFILLVTIELLRRRSLREKYAAVWLGVSLVVVVFAIYPGALVGIARLLGFAVPANLLFFAGGVVLTVISMQLSLETGRLEDESQRLAEEVALLRLDLRRLAARVARADTGTAADGREVATELMSGGTRPAERGGTGPGEPADRDRTASAEPADRRPGRTPAAPAAPANGASAMLAGVEDLREHPAGHDRS